MSVLESNCRNFNFHLSDRYIGISPTLIPTLPRDPMLNENDTIERISVSYDLLGCLIALSTTFYVPTFWYCYINLSQAHDCIRVPDSGITNEMWLLYPERFYYAGKISSDVSSTIKVEIIQKKSIEIRGFFEGFFESC